MGLCKITYKECCITLTCIAKFSNDNDLRLLMVTIISKCKIFEKIQPNFTPNKSEIISARYNTVKYLFRKKILTATNH